MKRLSFLACLNYALFAAILAAGAVPLTGLRAHEWSGVAIVVLVVVHISARWKWLLAASRGLRTPSAWRLRVNVAINTVLLVAATMTIYSGLMISQSVLPAFGLHANDSPFWDSVHKASQLLMTFAIGLHLAINWDWIVKATRVMRRKKLSTSVERRAFTRKIGT
jgi:hypothetical protein